MMAATWYFLVAAMLTTYVVLDGFDLGAGVLHLVVAKRDAERRTVLAAIGPVWDGNEVWLVAAGGALVYAFPRLYAAALSGFYLPVMVLLWVIILRGVAIELRSHVEHPLWSSFWDAVFAAASTTIAFVLGVALGNVVRGVALDQSGYFAMPLFTDFRPGPRPGAFDWYTLLCGALAIACLAVHGASYLIWKTTGPVQDRARALFPRAWTTSAALLGLVTGASAFVSPRLFSAFAQRPWAWPFPLVSVAAAIVALRATARRLERTAFLGTAVFLASTLAGAALALFPTFLASTLDRSFDLDAFNTSSSARGLALGLAWWIPALAVVVAYFVVLFRWIRGKVSLEEYGH
jgi:cytochrome d ubiquinol oxidase subunit II